MELIDFCTCNPQEIKEKLGKVPELPVAAEEVLRMLDEDDNSASALASVICQDQALTVRILRIANSSFYGLSRQVKTLQDAVVILGARVLRNLVIAMALKGLHHKFDALERNLWEESVGYACGARFIAERNSKVNPEEAFLAGLMCNIGELICNNSDTAQYRALLEQEYDSGTSRDEIALDLLGYSFAQSGAIILDQWNLAPEISVCTLLADEPEALDTSDRQLVELVNCVFISRGICRHLAIGNNVGPMCDINSIFARGGLELSAEEAQNLILEFADFFNTNKDEILRG
ncbi:MAG: HDOD domain-containing protein [Thermodesulfobacteriota bacterium]